MKNLNKIFYVSIILILFSSCANTVDVQDCVVYNPSGFWSGLWHGITLPFSFIGSLFSDNIAIYSINNNGGWYNFGFVLGTTAAFKTTTTKSKK